MPPAVELFQTARSQAFANEDAARVAAALARALGQLKDPRATNVLLEALSDSTFPAVQAAAVVAKPDEKWGETPCAFVELKPDTSATTDELVAWCRKHLAGYKCPRFVVFAELPKTSTGKIQKFKLREMAKEV